MSAIVCTIAKILFHVESLFMRPTQIEYWALQIIDRVLAGQPNEDTRVELKSEWIAPQKAARRLAGHANAARGEAILWLIGVDEKGKKVVGAEDEELADWFAQVQAQFDGRIAPALTDVNVPSGDVTVVALYFETDRAPYVVKNPKQGTITHEVPWREGTRTRTARRSDLIKLLVPVARLPEVEILSGRLNVSSKHDEYYWSLNLEAYITPTNNETCVLPFHRCEISLELEGAQLGRFEYVEISPFYDSLTISSTDSEVIVEGPGSINITRFIKTPRDIELDNTPVKIEIKLGVAQTDQAIVLHETLHQRESKGSYIAIWAINDLPS